MMSFVIHFSLVIFAFMPIVPSIFLMNYFSVFNVAKLIFFLRLQAQKMTAVFVGFDLNSTIALALTAVQNNKVSKT